MLPKSIPLADTIHFAPTGPPYRSPIRCGVERIRTPRNYSFSWDDVTCAACLDARTSRAKQKLADRIISLKARIMRDTALLQELEAKQAAGNA